MKTLIKLLLILLSTNVYADTLTDITYFENELPIVLFDDVEQQVEQVIEVEIAKPKNVAKSKKIRRLKKLEQIK